MFSILHLSDLHRSPEEPVENDSLIAALLSDADRYITETPLVPAPDAIIISGDLIQGTRIGDTNWRQTMSDQYRVAGDFLNELTLRFLNGDRSKIIIIPGNHDVCWNTSISAMDLVPPDQYPQNIRQALTEPDSKYRWCWKTLKLYKIINQPVYEQRMQWYWDFVEDFYAGVALFQPIDRSRGYQLFELFDRKIVVAAFDSIEGNDCFSYSGAIKRGKVAHCNLQLRDIQHVYSLKIALWHHSIQGPPLKEDYMDLSQVHQMAGFGFHLGIHGHQHVAETTTHYVHLNETQAMPIVSAGSLCAGSRELPRGVNRQYNVIVISDDFQSADVHVREMSEGEQFLRKTTNGFAEGFAKVSWATQADADLAGRRIEPKKVNSDNAVLKAEEAVNANDWTACLELLSSIDMSQNIYARKLFIQAAIKLGNWSQIINSIPPPQSQDEIVYLVTAYIETNQLEAAEAILDNVTDLDFATRKNLNDQVAIKKMLRKK